MFDIGNCEIEDLEDMGLTKEHIRECLDDWHRHEVPKYWWHGRIVQKGSLILHTDKGDKRLYFRVANHKAEQLILTEA